MNTKNQRRIVMFFQTIDGIKRHEWVHGTLYLKLEDDRDCDFVHTEIRKFYKGYINPEGGVNMYAVGDEFAFDFVPLDREAPVFNDEDYSGKEGMMPDDIDNGVWSEFAEEEMLNNLDEDDLIEAQAEIQMQLEAESKRGK